MEEVIKNIIVYTWIKSNEEECEERESVHALKEAQWSRLCDNSVDSAEEGLEDSSVLGLQDPYRKGLAKRSHNFHFLLSSPNILSTGQGHS
jgi:hypothetical protein